MASQVILHFYILLVTQVGSIMASYCFGTYSTHYYSFYCSGKCCGSDTRYCCYSNDMSDAIVAGVVIGTMFTVVVIVIIIMFILKKCNRNPVQPGIVISNSRMAYRPRNNVFVTNATFELPPYSPASDPPKYESITEQTSPRETSEPPASETNVPSTSNNENIIPGQPPCNHNGIRDSEL